MERRAFLSSMAAAGASALVADGIGASPATAQRASFSGTDLSGWRTVLGDGIGVAPGQTPATGDDVRTTHRGTHSVLEANIHERGIMAHNITFNRFVSPEGLQSTYRGTVEFRLPELPTTSNWTYNAQTLEISMFVWDGPDTRLDYGLAIQWALNPWTGRAGEIRAWSMTENGPEWQPVDYLEPDTEWHRFSCQYQPGGPASVRLDQKNDVPVAETLTPKYPHWGDTVDARFNMEIVSVWPGAHPSVPAFSAEFRNWTWGIT